MAQEAKKEIPTEVKSKWRVLEWFPDLSADQAEKLLGYKDFVIKFNKSINLISSKTLDEIDSLHFADTILGTRLVSKKLKAKVIWDFGSGNGFPGIIFAILNPDIEIKLLDSDERKAEFLKHVAFNLKLKNVEVVCKTIETLPADSIQNAMCRGLAPIWKCILMTKACMAPGSTFFHFKSLEWMAEVSQIPPQLCAVFKPKLVGNYCLPGGRVEYAVVQTDRV